MDRPRALAIATGVAGPRLRPRVYTSPVILSVAKDLMPVATGDEVLRYAQDDREETYTFIFVIEPMSGPCSWSKEKRSWGRQPQSVSIGRLPATSTICRPISSARSSGQ